MRPSASLGAGRTAAIVTGRTAAIVSFFRPRTRLQTMSLTLYEKVGCPYCAKVKGKLDELGLEYDSKLVPASRAERDEVVAVSGQAGVPVLVDPEHGVEGMAESADIVAYLEATYGDGATA